jgi:hypothetical protein
MASVPEFAWCDIIVRVSYVAELTMQGLLFLQSKYNIDLQ